MRAPDPLASMSDRLTAGDGDDTIWGGPGGDYLDGDDDIDI